MTYRRLTDDKRKARTLAPMQFIVLAVFVAILAFVAWKTPSASRR